MPLQSRQAAVTIRTGTGGTPTGGSQETPRRPITLRHEVPCVGILSGMNVKQALAELEALVDERVRKLAVRDGARDQFGVQLGDIRKLAKRIKSDHDLGLSLWETGNVDARLVAILVIKPKKLTAEEVDRMVRSVDCVQVADWLSSYVVKKHPDHESLRSEWMGTDDRWAARAGWSLTATRVVKSPDGLDLSALLDRIEAEMGNAAPEVQWTMNWTLGEIGIHHKEHRQRVLAIGEALGLYRDYPVSKGCTSPFVPIWVEEMVSRQG